MNRSRIRLVVALFACVTQSSAADWTSVSVPSEQSFRGYAWYRTGFKPTARFFAKHERDFWGESVILNIRGLAGAHEAYVNGKRIGAGGVFPPEFKDGREGNHRHKVPSGSLSPDSWNELAVRVYNPEGKGGFLSEAPFLMTYDMECVFEGQWEFLRGDTRSPFRGVLKTRPVTSAFDDFHESNRVLGEAEQFVHGEKLSPEKS